MTQWDTEITEITAELIDENGRTWTNTDAQGRTAQEPSGSKCDGSPRSEQGRGRCDVVLRVLGYLLL